MFQVVPCPARPFKSFYDTGPALSSVKGGGRIETKWRRHQHASERRGGTGARVTRGERGDSGLALIHLLDRGMIDSGATGGHGGWMCATTSVLYREKG